MASTQLPNFDSPGSTVLKPAALAHVALRTSKANYQKMTDFYATFLGAHVTFSNDFLSLVTYDDEHHRVAILALDSLSSKDWSSPGLEHMAFTYLDLPDLCLAYRQRKAHGILPFLCVNHGPTTSLYYSDPDGNRIETQVDNFATSEEATAYMMGPQYRQNPIGVAIDPEDLIRRMRDGESSESLKMMDPDGEVVVPPQDG